MQEVFSVRSITNSRWWVPILFIVALSFVLILNGAVPFLASPTLGQAVAMTGFSQSFANDTLLTVYSHYFGVPNPAALAMGMPVAYPAGFLIRLGVHATDAYSAMMGMWLTLAFIGAYLFSRILNVTVSFAIVGAVVWMSMPIIWAHAGYSSLSTGIALLALYLWLSIRLFLYPPKQTSVRYSLFASYVFFCAIALFMDGYSFMMFAIGSSLLAGYIFLRYPELRSYLLKKAFVVHVVGFSLAYLLYATYIGKLQFDPAPLDFFRGWGLDLTFLIAPTQGIHWFWDTLGWSIPRSDKEFFGDASVWMTTFSLPLIIVGGVSWWFVKGKHKLACGFLLIALFGFYMAMGPSLKIASTKPELMGPLMPAERAIALTGNEVLSAYIPGFKSMRASYRWIALFFLGLWALLVLLLGQSADRHSRIWSTGVLLALVISNLPNIKNKWQEHINYREAFLRIDKDLVEPLSQDIDRNELVVFLPYRNDFMINYLAPKLGIRTYNIGGDKQLFAAKKHWSATMKEFKMGQIDSSFVDRILLLLVRGEADVVVLPYVDMLWAAHAWPYPVQFKNALLPHIVNLNASGLVDTVEREYYAVVRLNKETRDLSYNGVSENRIMQSRCWAPVCLKRHQFSLSTHSKVGGISGKSISSMGQRGFILFGPYLPMRSGVYQITLFGASSAVESAWVDVVSSKGAVSHGKFLLSTTVEGENGKLAQGIVTLESAVKDIEIRVFVDKYDVVRVDRYELLPIDNLNGSDQTTVVESGSKI